MKATSAPLASIMVVSLSSPSRLKSIHHTIKLDEIT